MKRKRTKIRKRNLGGRKKARPKPATVEIAVGATEDMKIAIMTASEGRQHHVMLSIEDAKQMAGAILHLCGVMEREFANEPLIVAPSMAGAERVYREVKRGRGPAQ